MTAPIRLSATPEQLMSIPQDNLVRESALEAPRPSLALELVSFLLVGGAGAACFIGLSVLMIGLRTGLPDWIVSALCYAALILPVYVAHHRLSFRSRATHATALPRYIAVQLSAAVLAALFSFVFYNIFGVTTLVAAVLVAALTAGVNFFILKLWAFAARS